MCCIVLTYKFYKSYQDPALKYVIWPTDHGLYLFLLQISMIVAHASQFIAVNLQLFVSVYYRKNYATCLSII